MPFRRPDRPTVRRLVARLAIEACEPRRLLAAHIAGQPESYATIQAAVDAASAGATVTVDAGTYQETVTINKTLTLLGAQAGVDARTGRGAESVIWGDPSAVIVAANDVTIDGFTIQGNKSNVGAGLAAGVYLRPSIHGSHVLNNVIQNNVTGLYLSNDSDTDAAVIQRNYFYNNTETGADWTYGWNGSRAIYTDGEVSGGRLTNVLIDSNRFYRDDSFAGEGMIALTAQGAGKQFNVTISRNAFNSFNGYSSKAILVFNIENLSIIGNDVTNMSDPSSGPLRFEGNAHDVNLTYNNVYLNGGQGVGIDSSGVNGNSSDFHVTYNNLASNGSGIGLIAVDTDYDGTLWATNNWWGNATGPSGAGTGTGQQVWANGVSGHGVRPYGLPGGTLAYSPWATAAINTTALPAPAVRTGLTATSLSTTQIALSWTAPYDTAFNQLVQRSTDGGATFVTIATISPLVQAYTDAGLSSGKAYAYRVIAANPTGQSAASNVASVAPPTYQAPSPATGLTVKATTDTTATLSWLAPAYPYGIAGYVVYRNGAAIATVTSGTTFTDTGLTPSAAYTYALVTKDTLAATSAATPAVRAVTTPTPVQLPRVGPTIGTAGSYANSGNTIYKATDGNLGTFFDAPTSTGGWVGFDLGSNQAINAVSFAPRGGWSKRMVGGVFQASTSANFSSGVTTLYTVPAIPTEGMLTTVALPSTTARYFRYLSAVSGYCDIAELRFFGPSTGAATALADGGFETTPVAGSAVAPTTASWTFAGQAGLQANGSVWGALAAPEGTQTAFLQGNGTTPGSATQQFVANGPGTYAFTFSLAGRNGFGAQPVAVKVDGVTVGTYSPASSSFQSFTTNGVNLTTGLHTLTFAATNNVGDTTSFLDAVSIKALALTVAAPSAPAGLTASGYSASQVRLTWTPVGVAATSYTLQRSTDGVTFANIATIAADATSYLDGTLSAGTTYTYRLLATNTGGTSPASNTTSAATLASGTGATTLSGLTWSSSTSTYGTTQLNRNVNGGELVLRGTTYASGLGTHAVSQVGYDLGGKYSRFQSTIGIDDSVPTYVDAAVVFQVWGDGSLLFDSGVLTRADAAVGINVSVAGVSKLTLVATNGIAGTIDYDSADWAGATLVGTASGTVTPPPVTPPTTPTTPSAPTGVRAAAVSGTQVRIAWTNTATTATATLLQRSVDGGSTWATIATLSATATSALDTAAVAGATYSYRVIAVNSGVNSAASAVAALTTPAASAVVANLASLNWTSATSGWQTTQKNATVAGKTITLRGTTYATGLGTHAESTVTYNLAGGYTRFLSDVGIDDETSVGGQVIFRVFGDGKLLYDSGTLLRTSDAASADVNLTGVQTLTLVATAAVAGDIDFAHADWAGARLVAAAAATPPLPAPTPTVIGTSGSYANGGNTIAKAVDNDLNTYFDGPVSTGNWVGVDFGAATTVKQIAFAPRSGWASRMVGGLFQMSTSADFKTGVTNLYTVTTAPAAGVLTTVTLSVPATARFFRYLSPSGSYGNVAEVRFLT